MFLEMKPYCIPILCLAGVYICQISPVRAQGSPEIVWQAPTPSGIANSIVGVGWSPLSAGSVSFGSTDRYLRTRQADDGSLLYSVLQPIHSGTADQTIYSTD